MGRAAIRIEVTTKDRMELRKLLSGGVQQVRVVLRAVALLQLAKGVSAPRIAAGVPLTPQAIRKIGHRYQQGGLDRALYEKQRPGAEALLEDSQKQRIIAMVCSNPPEGSRKLDVTSPSPRRTVLRLSSLKLRSIWRCSTQRPEPFTWWWTISTSIAANR
jgi:putative transposase